MAIAFIQQEIETPLARQIVGGSLADGETVKIDCTDGALTFRN